MGAKTNHDEARGLSRRKGVNRAFPSNCSGLLLGITKALPPYWPCLLLLAEDQTQEVRRFTF
jgi:hypothetical protein